MSCRLNRLHKILISDTAGFNDLSRVIQRALMVLLVLYAFITATVIGILELQVLE